MNQHKVRGIRGAVTVDADEPQAILEATKRLLQAVMERNEITLDDIASVFITLTPDLRSVFPAVAARAIGWVHVPMLHAVEVDVPGALPHVVRVQLPGSVHRPAVLLELASGQRPLSGPVRRNRHDVGRAIADPHARPGERI